VVVSLEEITCGNLIALDFERQYYVTFFTIFQSTK